MDVQIIFGTRMVLLLLLLLVLILLLFFFTVLGSNPGPCAC
jgi:hypothetical protein